MTASEVKPGQCFVYRNQLCARPMLEGGIPDPYYTHIHMVRLCGEGLVHLEYLKADAYVEPVPEYLDRVVCK